MSPGIVRPIARVPIRSEIRRILLESMLRGDPAPGDAINESELSVRLGVSRTPLREALHNLAGEGYLGTIPGKGFFVLPLSAKEAQDLYPIVAALERLALRTSPPFTPADLERLARINRELGSARANWEAALKADERWHEKLVSRCGNERLLETIRALKYHAQRYESAYMRHSGTILSSMKQHREILRSLEEGDLDAAERFLDANWNISLEFLLPWLEEREANAQAIRSRKRTA